MVPFAKLHESSHEEEWTVTDFMSLLLYSPTRLVCCRCQTRDASNRDIIARHWDQTHEQGIAKESQRNRGDAVKTTKRRLRDILEQMC